MKLYGLGLPLNDDRFKSGSSGNYFNELQERIRLELAS
ncbi:MAG: virulence RhuM family protein [Prolixibacteraceae bacterium]|nr:virulence RhuM family protein [Prolixibacteraceae bacterium]